VQHQDLILNFELYIIGIVIFVAVSIIYYTVKLGISPMPSVGFAKKVVIQAVPSETTGTVVDLGSGWGTLLFSLAKKFPHCRFIGYELSPLPYAISFLRKWLFRYQNVTILRRDFFQESLDDASVVLCYLFPHTMERLSSKFTDELSESSLVISNTFAIHQWTPIRVLQVPDLYNTKIFVYRVNYSLNK